MQTHAPPVVEAIRTTHRGREIASVGKTMNETALMEIVLLRYAGLQMARHYFAVNVRQDYSP